MRRPTIPGAGSAFEEVPLNDEPATFPAVHILSSRPFRRVNLRNRRMRICFWGIMIAALIWGLTCLYLYRGNLPKGRREVDAADILLLNQW